MWYQKYLAELRPDSAREQAVIADIRPRVAALLKPGQVDVSIVAIAHNEAERILACIHSLACVVTDLSVEIIVVSNASEDRTLELAQACGVIALNQPLKGVGHARQAGLERARGIYHLCADGDSFYPPDYVEIMVRHLRKPGVVGVSAPCSFFADGRLSSTELYWYEWLRDVSVFLRSRNRPELATYGASFGFVTEIGQRIGWRTDFRLGEDGYMAVQLKKFGRVVVIMDRKARIRTTARTLDRDGSLGAMVAKRIRREFARIKVYLTHQQDYDDTPSNMLPPSS
jgi:glycosyltransferase involved in cell wall biosynthesis